MKKKTPNFLTNLIPKSHQSFRTKTNSITTFCCRTDCYKNSFFPSALNDWFQLDVAIRNSELIAIFKSRLLSFIRPIQSDVYNIFDHIGLKFLTHLRLDFSHLNEHRLRHNFQDCLNPLCSCSLQTEDRINYLRTCHHFSQHRIDLINSVKYIFEGFDSLSDIAKKDLLLSRDPRFDINKNKLFYIKSTETFSGSKFD